MKRIHAIFTGDVQGVGFRFTASHLAKEFNISGWVKNLTNGSVELVAEGKKDNLDTFLNLLEREMTFYIKSKQIDHAAGEKEFHSFSIKY